MVSIRISKVKNKYESRNTKEGNIIKLKKGKKYRILLIDSGVKEYYKSLAASLKECRIIIKPDKGKAGEFFFHNDLDLVLLDHNNDAPCIEMLQFFKSVKPFVPVIIVTDCGSEELAVTVFRYGARDYFKKPFVMDELRKGIKSALGIRDISGKGAPDKTCQNLFRAVRYIDENYCMKIKLSQITKEAGMSISCFERTFKKRMGVTFTMYVNKLRISKAMGMLKEDGLSMNDIAFACGFTNQFHFTRMFRKITKLSPRLYKKSLKE